MPGLTRASIYIARDFSKQMDCRVKPGNDILMAFARNTRRDREAVSVGGCCLKIESIVAAITRSASDEILSVVIPGWSEGPDVRCAIAHRGISRFRARCGACHRAALCADPLASPRNDGFWIASLSLSPGREHPNAGNIVCRSRMQSKPESSCVPIVSPGPKSRDEPAATCPCQPGMQC